MLEKNHDSSMIKKTKYNPVEEKLTVTFNNDSEYEYDNFKQLDYDNFMNAESKGKHFLKNIRDNFTTTRIN